MDLLESFGFEGGLETITQEPTSPTSGLLFRRRSCTLVFVFKSVYTCRCKEVTKERKSGIPYSLKYLRIKYIAVWLNSAQKQVFMDKIFMVKRESRKVHTYVYNKY